MKAPSRQSSTREHPHSHSTSHGHSRSHSILSAKSPRSSTTPAVSPRVPYSVGQNLPPSISPHHVQDVRSPSPNYFGIAIDTNESRDSSGPHRDNWSTPTSSIKSFGAAIPKQVSIDANPDFEAFRRQADLNRGKSFALSTPFEGRPANSPSFRAPPPRWQARETGNEEGFPRTMPPSKDTRPASRMDIDNDIDSPHDSAYVSSDSKRNSEASLVHPAAVSKPGGPPGPLRINLTRSEDRDPRLSVMGHRPDPPSPKMSMSRAATLPSKLEQGQPSMITGQELKDMLKNSENKKLLVLDIRSSQNYAQSRIRDALNLCIPTTLLKRATFNIQKLQQTFQSGPDSERFAQWRDANAIVVYDSHSSETRDAVSAQNMIKKFTNEGYTGDTHILRGGFSMFKETHPQHVDHRSTMEIAGSKCQPGLAPVIGGVMLPTAKNDANPFFSNIRQNIDLADGVGQLDVSRPTGLESPSLPRWLRDAAAVDNHGKKVSDHFYHIEKDEQSRMKSAYAAFNLNNPRTGNEVQLCGVEKGGKNRYKDILPFEHARVKLQTKKTGSCDYINASHVQASRSNKRYIATQGPLPATFEDFWSVIWEQDVRVVVMLTAESEGGQLKCHPYWKGRDHGAIKLKLLSEKKASLDIDKHRADSQFTPSSFAMGETGRRRANTTTSLESSTPSSVARDGSEAPHVVIRKFALSHTAHPFAPMREITHLHFAGWPDFGTPAKPAHLLALVELANVMQRAALPVDSSSLVGAGLGQSADSIPIAWFDEPEADARARPMLVHCSAGCGRTGTFCTVDSVIDMLKRGRQSKITKTAAGQSDEDVDMDDADTDTDSSVSPKGTTQTTTSESLARAQGEHPQKRRKSGSETIDTLWMRDDTIDLIQRTVQDFRSQRLSMVQSLRQYVLCYETVIEWVNRVNDRSSSSMVGGRARSGSLRTA